MAVLTKSRARKPLARGVLLSAMAVSGWPCQRYADLSLQSDAETELGEPTYYRLRVSDVEMDELVKQWAAHRGQTA